MLLKIKIWLYIHYLKQWYGYKSVSTKLLYAQAYHETGNFNSPVFLQNKNLFGMRQPSVRKNYTTGSNLGHATFSNHFNSVRDYFERQKYFKIPNTNDAGYMDATLNSNYAEDQNYKQKWLNIRDNVPVSPFIKYSNYAVGLVALVIAFYCFRAVWRLQRESGKNQAYQTSVKRFSRTQPKLV